MCIYPSTCSLAALRFCLVELTQTSVGKAGEFNHPRQILSGYAWREVESERHDATWAENMQRDHAAFHGGVGIQSHGGNGDLLARDLFGLRIRLREVGARAQVDLDAIRAPMPSGSTTAAANKPATSMGRSRLQTPPCPGLFCWS
jgi:hypothetical protein